MWRGLRAGRAGRAGRRCSRDVRQGDDWWSSVCFAEETGFASGTWGWAGGSTEENVFTVIR